MTAAVSATIVVQASTGLTIGLVTGLVAIIVGVGVSTYFAARQRNLVERIHYVYAHDEASIRDEARVEKRLHIPGSDMDVYIDDPGTGIEYVEDGGYIDIDEDDAEAPRRAGGSVSGVKKAAPGSRPVRKVATKRPSRPQDDE